MGLRVLPSPYVAFWILKHLGSYFLAHLANQNRYQKSANAKCLPLYCLFNLLQEKSRFLRVSYKINITQEKIPPLLLLLDLKCFFCEEKV